jgi:monoamine oxidase
VDTGYDVAIIGAGASGLAAAQQLLQSGLRVCCLEARNRIGGRIYTVHDAPVPIELGAEFVHGRPAEIVELAERAGLPLCETGGRPVSLVESSGFGSPEEDGFRVLEDLTRLAGEEHDETFQSFLDRSDYSVEQQRQASAFVEGFNAARREVIGVASLAQDQRASDLIEGDRAFRVREGYDALMDVLARGVDIRLDTQVDAIEWRKGEATVWWRKIQALRVRRVLITVPLGVLQSNAIRFEPEPSEALAAARSLRFGDAFRVTFLFDRAFWEERAETEGAGFLFSDEPLFPVWWTGRPAEPRLITGWSAGPKADALLGLSRDAVIARALETLSRIMRMHAPAPRGAWFHDWHADPYSRGAYSYVPAGALPARRKLAQPVADTLFFAGEATDQIGYGGTVHGAIASGRRAAGQILGAESQRP